MEEGLEGKGVRGTYFSITAEPWIYGSFDGDAGKAFRDLHVKGTISTACPTVIRRSGATTDEGRGLRGSETDDSRAGILLPFRRWGSRKQEEPGVGEEVVSQSHWTTHPSSGEYVT